LDNLIVFQVGEPAASAIQSRHLQSPHLPFRFVQNLRGNEYIIR
jgi:hypothetical protein